MRWREREGGNERRGLKERERESRKVRERRNEGPRKRVEGRVGGELLYSDKTLGETAVYTDLCVSRLVPPDDQRKFTEGI